MKHMLWTPLPLEDVRVTDRFAQNAFRKELDYLLSLEPGRLLKGFYENAGIDSPFVRYGGWENTLIGGHTLGHYLSALAHAYASAPKEDRAALLSRLKELIEGLHTCQNAVGSGLIWGALPVAGGIEAQFDNVERGRVDIKRQAWVPWYTLHKLLNGLLDVRAELGMCGGAAREISAEALEIAAGLGDWVARRALGWDTRTAKQVLSVEYGGMNDCLYTLYSCTGDPRYAEAAHVFDEEPLFDGILAEEKDFLDGKHANATIPKVLGALNRYLVLHGKKFRGEVVDASRYLAVAETFFRTVTEKHAYITGGVSEWEHFGRDFVLDAERTNCNCETCCVYNLLKLVRGLFSVTGDARYLDYYDNAFVNSILASQNPESGMTTYFQPMASGFFKVFSRPYDKFWCCTGSGMENFSKLGDGIFYTGEQGVVLARYLSSELHTPSFDCSLRADFPFDDEATLTVGRAEGAVRFLLRIPDWCLGEPQFLGEGVPSGVWQGNFYAVTLQAGDVLRIKFPVGVTLHGLPDGDNVYAFRYGGTVLAADFGTEDMTETTTGVDVTIPQRQMGSERVWFEDVEDVIAHPSSYLIREGRSFLLHGADRPLHFQPYYLRFRERYAIYLAFSEYVWENGVPVKRETKNARETLDSVQPGYGQYENDALHEMRERNTGSSTSDGTYRYAKAGGFFAYDFLVDPARRNYLQIILAREDNGRPLKITADGQTLLSEHLLYTMGERSYTRELAIPPDVVSAARKKTVDGREVSVITVEFSTFGGRAGAKLYDSVRMLAD